MAKRQNFIVGSTNSNTEVQTVTELNEAWNQYAVLHSGKLDGVFNAVSDYSNDSSNEIANAIQSITGSEPTGANQNELAGALSLLRTDIESTSLLFKGYVATSAPSASTYSLKVGNLWINASAMPTSFPVAASSIKRWNGSSWVNYGSTYTPANFHFFRNINNKAGYYWLGGAWAMFSTDFSTNYFTLNSSTGKWQISTTYNNNLVHKTTDETIAGTKTFSNQIVASSGNGIKFSTGATDYFAVRSAGSPSVGLNVLLNNDANYNYMAFASGSIRLGTSGVTTTLAGTVNAPNVSSTSDSSTKVATTYWVHSITNLLAPKASPAFTGTPTAPTQSSSNNSTRIATTAFVHSITDSLAPKASPTFTGTPKAPTPATSDNSTQIATTQFVKAQGYALDNAVVKLTGSQTVAGTKTFSNICYGKASANANSILTTVKSYNQQTSYIHFGNGLKLQWGFMGDQQGNRVTINLPLAFNADGSYYVFFTIGNSTVINLPLVYVDNSTQTTTSFQVIRPGGTSTLGVQWFAIGW